MQRSVFVLSQPKTATQSVFRSLRDAHPGLPIHYAHNLDQLPRVPKTAPDLLAQDAAALARWRHKFNKQHRLLRGLLDARMMKTVVAIRRDPEARLWSELFHSQHKAIARFYDRAQDRFDLTGLQARLSKTAAQAEAAGLSYADEVYAPLGIAAGTVEEGQGVTRIRADLEVMVLRFESLAEDFAELVDHLGLPPTALEHANPARDRSRDDAGRDRRRVEVDEQRLYSAFLRDFPKAYREQKSRLAA